MNQQEFDIKTEEKALTNVSDFRFAPIKGQPMLQWRGKRPFTSTSYFPAQEKEQHGEEMDGWLNKIFWGDNIQVMSQLYGYAVCEQCAFARGRVHVLAQERHRPRVFETGGGVRLLVNKGREGWNCRSLFAVAMHRDPDSKIFVLQATMRCLRSIGSVQETGYVYLSDKNKEILNEELQNNFQMNVDELNGAGVKGRKPVEVRPVPPPVKVRIKRVVNHYELRERKLTRKAKFDTATYDLGKYQIVKTTSDIRHLDREAMPQTVLYAAKEKHEFTPLTLTAEIARYLNLSPIRIEEILEDSEEGMAAVLEVVNKCNELLYDEIIPRLFKGLYETQVRTEVKEEEVLLVKPPEDGQEYFSFHVNVVVDWRADALPI